MIANNLEMFRCERFACALTTRGCEAVQRRAIAAWYKEQAKGRNRTPSPGDLKILAVCRHCVRRVGDWPKGVDAKMEEIRQGCVERVNRVLFDGSDVEREVDDDGEWLAPVDEPGVFAKHGAGNKKMSDGVVDTCQGEAAYRVAWETLETEREEGL